MTPSFCQRLHVIERAVLSGQECLTVRTGRGPVHQVGQSQERNSPIIRPSQSGPSQCRNVQHPLMMILLILGRIPTRFLSMCHLPPLISCADRRGIPRVGFTSSLVNRFLVQIVGLHIECSVERTVVLFPLCRIRQFFRLVLSVILFAVSSFLSRCHMGRIYHTQLAL